MIGREYFSNGSDYLLYKVLRFLILLVPFIPLVIIRSFESPFNFGKGVALRFLVQLIVAIYLYLAIKYEQLRPSVVYKDWKRYELLTLICVVVIVIWSIISSIFGKNWGMSFWGDWERMGGVFFLLHLVAFGLIALLVFRSHDEWRDLIWISVVAAMVSVIYGILQKFSIGSVVGADERLRIFGTAGNPAVFSSYLLFNIYFAFYLSNFLNSKFYKAGIYLVIIIFSAGIFMSAVKGSIIALVLSLMFFVIYRIAKSARLSRNQKVTFSLLVIFLIIISVTLAMNFRSGGFQGYWGRLTNFKILEDTATQRLIIWDKALKGITQKPILGWGYDNFLSLFFAQYDPKLFIAPDDNALVGFDRAHNIFLEWFSTLGAVGLVSFLLIWVAVLLKMRSSSLPNSHRVPLYSLAVAYFVNNFFFFDTTSTYLTLVLFLGLCFSIDKEAPVNSLAGSLSLSKISSYALRVVLFICLVVAFVWTVLFPIKTNKNTADANRFLFAGEYKTALSKYMAARQFSGPYITDVSRSLATTYESLALGNDEFVKEEANKKMYEILVGDLRKQTNKRFNDAFTYEFLFKITQAFNYKSQLSLSSAEDIIKEAITKFPNFLIFYYNHYNNSMIEGNYSKAAEIAELMHSIRSDSSFINFWLNYAEVRLYLKGADKLELDKYLTLLINTFDSIIFSKDYYDQITAPYVNELSQKLKVARYYTEVRDLHLKMAEFKPFNYIYVAYACYYIGDKACAFKYADMALGLGKEEMEDPNNFQILSNLYGLLGDNVKKGEAYYKAI